MRHTLIPNSIRATMRKEYRVRLVIVLCFMLSVSVVIGIVSLIPSYMSSYVENNNQTQTLNTQKQRNSSKKAVDYEKEITLEKQIIDEIKSTGFGEKLLSPKIKALVELKGSVRISSVSLNREVDGKITTVIQGLASTRQSLLSYKSRIENSDKNLSVNLPISQLAQSSNIRFTMQVKEK